MSVTRAVQLASGSSDPGEAVGKGARDVNKFALVVSAVCSASLKQRGRARARLTCQPLADLKIQVRQRGAVREGIQRPCGSEESRYSQRCQGVQISDGLGGQGFKLAISRRRARARTFNLPAPPQLECDERGAFGE